MTRSLLRHAVISETPSTRLLTENHSQTRLGYFRSAVFYLVPTMDRGSINYESRDFRSAALITTTTTILLITIILLSLLLFYKQIMCHKN